MFLNLRMSPIAERQQAAQTLIWRNDALEIYILIKWCQGAPSTEKDINIWKE